MKSFRQLFKMHFPVFQGRKQFGGLDEKAGDRLSLVFASQSEEEGSFLLLQDHYFNNPNFH